MTRRIRGVIEKSLEGVIERDRAREAERMARVERNRQNVAYKRNQKREVRRYVRA